MTVSRFHFMRIPGLTVLKDLVQGSIAFGQGAWHPIALLFSRLQEWNRARKPVGSLPMRSTHLSGVRVARRALLRHPAKDATGQHVHEPADTML